MGVWATARRIRALTAGGSTWLTAGGLALLILGVSAALTAGCGTGSRVREVPPEFKVYRPYVPPLSERHTSDRLEGIESGAWVRYRVADNGVETLWTLGVVRVEKEALWIEVIEEGNPRRASLRRVTPDGRVLQAWFRELPPSGPPSEVVDQPIAAEGAPPSRPRPVEVETSTGRMGAAGRSLEVTRIRRIFRDEMLGREFEEEETWSASVPALYAGTEQGGLVARRRPEGTIDLVDWGADYVAVVEP
ncbi:MAG: hypothetical protein HY716_10000 [Planctomycetes bacterium]|nr:hypothetical protein [Planctomycetota bacterium]